MHAWSWFGQHRLGTVLVIGFLMVLAAAAVWFVFFRSVSSPVSLRDAIRLYRSERAGVSARPDSPRPLSPGVYSYRTSGQEGLSMPGSARPFPARTEMVTTDGPVGCSTVDWVPIVQHTEATAVCTGPDRSLVIDSFVTYVQIGGTSSTSVIRCPAATFLLPPQPAVGEHWSASCHQRSPSMTVGVDGSVQGEETVDVGGRAVTGTRVRLVLRFGIGVSTTDMWISEPRGLLLREDEVADFSELGVRYTEGMSAGLVSLTPST